jgi:type VI secretion system protein ImpJ
MKYLSRVVWSEGMYLGPHHFQAQSRYFEDSIHFAAHSLWFEPWGLIAGQFDHEALQNGTVSLLHARGLFRDGLPFHIPECDPAPEPRQIAEIFPPTRDSVTVYLAVPPRRPDGLNCLIPESSRPQPGVRARFQAEAHTLHDETTGRDEKTVHVGRKNFELLLDIELKDDAEPLETLAVARVTRDGSGRFIYDPQFVPPCVDISASERIMALLRRLIEILEEKSATYARPKSGDKRTWSEFATRDIANFWLLHTVNEALAPLRHIYLSRRGHPEQLYSEMLRLGGALCTFGVDSHPSSLPLYNHEALDRCFADLDLHIRQHLETIAPTQFVQISLKKRAEYFYEGAITDQRCVGVSRWIFAIRSPVGEANLIAKAPQLVKLSSKQFLPELVKRAMPGLTLTHLPVPPAQIPSRVDFQYFSVTKAGGLWDHIVTTRQLGLYVPADLPSPDVELYVILDQP